MRSETQRFEEMNGSFKLRSLQIISMSLKLHVQSFEHVKFTLLIFHITIITTIRNINNKGFKCLYRFYLFSLL